MTAEELAVNGGITLEEVELGRSRARNSSTPRIGIIERK
jgi:hypothetical protein